jgi:hypothetical protein
MLVVALAGVNPAGGTCPVATVVISGGGASDQPVESPEVKASVGWGQPWSAPTREASKSTGRSESELQFSLEMGSLTRIGVWGIWKCRDFPYVSKASVIGEGTGCMQPMNFPGSEGATCRSRTINESTDPLVGCLGVVVQAHSDGISYKSPSDEVGMCLRVRRMGSFK